MHPRSNETPQAETVGCQGFSDAIRAFTAVLIVCCSLVALGTLFTQVHHLLPAIVYVVLVVCGFAQAWRLVADPIKALLREISEPFAIWDD